MAGKRIVKQPLPTFSDQLRRAIWRFCWLLFFRASPVPLFYWRVIILRAFGGNIAGSAKPYPSAKIWAPWNLVMERQTCLAPGVECYNVGLVTLRSGVTVSQQAFLCTASHDPHDPQFALVVGSIEIDSGAWIGAQAFVGPGTFVGRDAVVAARAVVVRDVPENVIVGGNPATVIGQRYVECPLRS
jgi:putative colanic acid biosynthesis acetyltransferase WcaF